MSLGITLIENEPCEVFEVNITHNLGIMASAAGLYAALWRPDELDGVKVAGDLVPFLEKGLSNLLDDEQSMKAHSPENGWGTWEGLTRSTRRYLAACKDHPMATIEVRR